MRFFVLAVVSAITGFAAADTPFSAYQRIARDVFGNMEKRQIPTCFGFGDTCADACGAGWVTCVTPDKCYNPSAGQQCCSDSNYCDAGTYCTDAGCCPNDQTLEECGAVSSLSVIPPSATPSTPASTSSAPTTSSTTTAKSTWSAKTTASVGSTTSANQTVNPTVPNQPPKATTNGAQKLAGGVLSVIGAVALLMAL